ncbi:universal stress protein [Chloroflexota bacterium]
MKILLALDGSSYSDMATKMVAALRLPSRTELTVLTVVPEHTFLGGITLRKIRGVSSKKEAQEQKALELLQEPVQKLSTPKLRVETIVRWGDPAEEILKVSNASQGFDWLAGLSPWQRCPNGDETCQVQCSTGQGKACQHRSSHASHKENSCH